MQSWLIKAKALGTKSKEQIEPRNSGKLSDHSASPSGSPSFSRKRREAALKAELFAGPDKIVSAANTYGLIKLTIHEAKVKNEQRYCAVVSIGMQVCWLSIIQFACTRSHVMAGRQWKQPVYTSDWNASATSLCSLMTMLC